MASSEIAILIPAYNEENTIQKVITETSPYGKVVVVDDCSIDRTFQIASNLNAIVLKNKKNLGYDFSLTRGVKYILDNNFKYFITFDADNQHKSKYLENFISIIRSDKFGVVIGDRNKINRISEKLFNKIFYIFFEINDILCGLKAYDVKILKKLDEYNFKNSLGTRLALLIALNKISVKQIKISINERKDASRIGGLIKANFKILTSLFVNIIEIIFWKKNAK